MTEAKRLLITGASSGIGRHAARLMEQEGHRLTLICRNHQRAAETLNWIGPTTRVLEADLADLEQVDALCATLLQEEQPIDALVLNAGLQYAGHRQPRWSRQGIELTLAVNHLAHQLMLMRLLPLLQQTDEPRVVITASEVHNPATGGGRVGRPAGLGDLAGLRSGAGSRMVDGSHRFDADKAYKDSKLCNMITTQELHRRLHGETGITFTSLYPGCVADTPLFRNTPKAFQTIFPWFQKNITGGYVSQSLAGERVADVLANPDFAESGVHWSWGNRQKKDGQQFSQELSDKATDPVTAQRVWDLSMQLVGL